MSQHVHLLIVRYTVPPAQVGPHVPAHVRYLERHHEEGVFLVSGTSVPAELGGAIVATGVSRERVEQITAEDPFVRAGVAAYEIVTIDAGRRHPALAELLGSATEREAPVAR
ncbi:YciI family protein [Marinitenerispora sediminis]|uniref:YCII-related domain-containing protein n=1 Tax=Marinitenerispora sediminis TaxID=1931232 RepID=A0A368T4Q4_9ACTN|nr:YciI family protein [Marinitenerispora sediminis]RCV56693.1 hypothetical protein DEF28_03200 [Marinitenerispora sediminis]RCV58458.1 hypothetical protein DEF24_13415 [Marinitenerispora sediminis]RCV61685.1 hypothetical protein DEF23_01910 [Marinitenerispora sediminis]